MSHPNELPERIGPYRVLGLLGQGATGRVYRAEEAAPRREVALKVLHGGDARFAARFQREIALLGALEHPGIARLYAAGTADAATGPLPYLAMEYVRGSDLLTHAEAQRLPVPERLRLLAAICHAVHYAHTRGIVHRDLKPANLFVDADGHPKVLDFGIAHVVADEAERTQMTRAGEVLGTLPYMSWEQLAGEPAALDPRADVFALGVIAYQLLSGRLPFAGGTGTSLVQALRERQERRPEPLSQGLPAARGDLETIVMKAMAAEPAARYGSAAELAADIERYLDRRPIEARPPTAAYVARLFVRRHRALAGGAALALLALLIGAGVAVRYGLSEAAARREAEQRLAERDAVSRFLEDMFVAADPERALGSRLTVRDVLDVARRELESGAELPPAVRAQLQRSLGSSYSGLGLPAQALPLLEAAEAAVRASSGPDSLEARRARLDTLHGLIRAGRQAEATADLEALAARAPGESAAERELHLQAVIELADHQIYSGSAKRAEALAAAALPMAGAQFGAEHPLTLSLGYERALALHMEARHDEAIAQAQKTIAGLERRFGAQHPRTQLARDVVALSYREQGRFAESEAIYRATLAAREQVLGPTHPQTAAVRVSLASVLALAGRAAEALPLARQAHADILRVLDPEAETARSVASLRAYVESENGEIATSAELNRGLIAQTEAKPGGPSENDLPDYNNLANQLMKLQRYAEARALFETLLKHAERLLGREHAHYGMFENNYGECLRQLGELEAARTALLHSRGVLEKQLEPGHPHRKRVVERLVQVEAALAARNR